MTIDTTPPLGDVQNYIDGEWRYPSSDDGEDIMNPATSEAMTYVGFSDASDVDDAVRAGQEDFEEWSQTPVEERIQPIFEFKQLLEEHQNELADILVQEHGKTMAEAVVNSSVGSKTWRWPVVFRR